MVGDQIAERVQAGLADGGEADVLGLKVQAAPLGDPAQQRLAQLVALQQPCQAVPTTALTIQPSP